MDSLIAAAARALAVGDALGALKRVALRTDAPALALRGTAMAQLGELARARELLREAARSFGAHEARSRARCVVAQAEVALAMRDLSASPRPLVAAIATLEAHADRANAMHARLVAVRRLLLLGRLDAAAPALAEVDTAGLPPALQTVAALTRAELALRSLHLPEARAALAAASKAADQAGVPALSAEVADAHEILARPAARRILAGEARALRLEEAQALRASGALVVDACRRELGSGTVSIALTRRPVLFVLALALARAWPGDTDRNELIAQAFRTRRPDETHRARLRVEIARLRKLMAPLARIEATARGFALLPRGEREVAVLLPPIDGEAAALQALLADGAAWSSSALALARGARQRTVQRALVELEAEGRVRSIGRARAQRWLAPPLAAFTTILLLPVALPLA
jgi:hypothetical protein